MFMWEKKTTSSIYTISKSILHMNKRRCEYKTVGYKKEIGSQAWCHIPVTPALKR